MTEPKSAALVEGTRWCVAGGTHAGKSGTVTDIKTRRTGHVALTVLPDRDVRFKTLARHVVVEGRE